MFNYYENSLDYVISRGLYLVCPTQYPLNYNWSTPHIYIYDAGSTNYNSVDIALISTRLSVVIFTIQVYVYPL